MKRFLIHSLAIFICFSFLTGSAPGSDSNMETTIGGQVKLSVSASHYNSDSIQSEFNSGDWIDSNLNLRVKTRTFFNDNLSFECHYVFSSSYGDTIGADDYFSEQYPGTMISQIFQTKFDDNDTKLLDLSSRIKKGDHYFVSHSIDRFNFNLEGNTGRVTLGRQAVTWGNGLVFNPMDILNPFSPYDLVRDYKKGEDMAYAETTFENGDELQLIYVPRRDSQEDDVRFSQSSAGTKFHTRISETDVDVLLVKHYEDLVAGVGGAATVGDAIMRSDIVYTFANGDMTDDFISLIVNIDYSWVWHNKNCYGFIEYYYSGIGEDDGYANAFLDHDFSTRIGRGEIYGLGKNYVSSHLRIELSPLVNFSITAITNLNDPSCLVEPEITWSAAENIEIKLGANIAFGGKAMNMARSISPFQQNRPIMDQAFFMGDHLFKPSGGYKIMAPGTQKQVGPLSKSSQHTRLILCGCDF